MGVVRDDHSVRRDCGVGAIPGQDRGNDHRYPPFLAQESPCCGTASSPNDNGQILYTLGASKSPSSFPPNPNLAVGIDPTAGGPTVVPV